MNVEVKLICLETRARVGVGDKEEAHCEADSLQALGKNHNEFLGVGGHNGEASGCGRRTKQPRNNSVVLGYK